VKKTPLERWELRNSEGRAVVRQVSSALDGPYEWRWTVVAKGGVVQKGGRRKTRQGAMEEAGWTLEYLTGTAVGQWERTT
jgi:hypothetical protein